MEVIRINGDLVNKEYKLMAYVDEKNKTVTMYSTEAKNPRKFQKLKAGENND